MAWLLALVALLVPVAYFGGKFEERGACNQRAALTSQIADLRIESERARVAQDLQGITHDAIKKAEAAQLDAVGARNDADRVRVEARALAKRATAAGGGEATDAALVVFAELLGRAEDDAARATALADERGIAGTACQRSYDALGAPAATHEQVQDGAMK